MNKYIDVKYAIASNQDVVYDSFGDCYDLSVSLKDDALFAQIEDAKEVMKELKESDRISFDDKKELHIIQIQFSANIKKVE